MSSRVETIALVCALCVTACATVAPEIKDDQSGQYITIKGPSDGRLPLGGPTSVWSIWSAVNKTGYRVSHKLYVAITYRDIWRSYESAVDDTSKSLPVTTLDKRTLLLMEKAERISIDLDDGTLRARAKTGYPVTISARSGHSMSITVTPEQIDLQTAAVDKYAK